MSAQSPVGGAATGADRAASAASTSAAVGQRAAPRTAMAAPRIVVSAAAPIQDVSARIAVDRAPGLRRRGHGPTIGPCGGGCSRRRWCWAQTSLVRPTELPRRPPSPAAAVATTTRAAARQRRQRPAVAGVGSVGAAVAIRRGGSRRARHLPVRRLAGVRVAVVVGRSAWRSPRPSSRARTSSMRRSRPAWRANRRWRTTRRSCSTGCSRMRAAVPDDHARARDGTPLTPAQLATNYDQVGLCCVHAVRREALLDPEAGRRRRHLRHGDGSRLALITEADLASLAPADFQNVADTWRGLERRERRSSLLHVARHLGSRRRRNHSVGHARAGLDRVPGDAAAAATRRPNTTKAASASAASGEPTCPSRLLKRSLRASGPQMALVALDLCH